MAPQGGLSELTVSTLDGLETNIFDIDDDSHARVFNGALLDASTLNINDGGESWLAGTPSMASLRTSMAAALMCNK